MEAELKLDSLFPSLLLECSLIASSTRQICRHLWSFWLRSLGCYLIRPTTIFVLTKCPLSLVRDLKLSLGCFMFSPTNFLGRLSVMIYSSLDVISAQQDDVRPCQFFSTKSVLDGGELQNENENDLPIQFLLFMQALANVKD